MKVLIHGVLAVIFCLTADYLLITKPFGSNEFWGLYDGAVHAFISLIVLLPFARKDNLILDYFLFLCIGGLIDIDHFIQAQSLSITDIISLPMRPASHSLTFIIGLSIIIWFFSKKWAIIIAIGLASHILRDASSGVTPLFYPSSFQRIPYWSYIALEFGLVLFSYFSKSRLNHISKA